MLALLLGIIFLPAILVAASAIALWAIAALEVILRVVINMVKRHWLPITAFGYLFSGAPYGAQLAVVLLLAVFLMWFGGRGNKKSIEPRDSFIIV